MCSDMFVREASSAFQRPTHLVRRRHPTTALLSTKNIRFQMRRVPHSARAICHKSRRDAFIWSKRVFKQVRLCVFPQPVGGDPLLLIPTRALGLIPSACSFHSCRPMCALLCMHDADARRAQAFDPAIFWQLPSRLGRGTLGASMPAFSSL